MPALKQLSITDGVTARTLSPGNKKGDIQEYRSNDATNRAGNATVKFSSKDASNANRILVRLTSPIVVTDTSTSEDVVRENAILEASFRFPSIMTAVERLLVVKQFIYCLDNDLALGEEISTGEGQW